MLCDICKTKEAKVLFTEISGGMKRNQYLCEECAQKAPKLHMRMPFGGGNQTIGSVISEMIENAVRGAMQHEGEGLNAEDNEVAEEAVPAALVRDHVSCKSCGMTFREFSEKKHFGCADCYSAFEKYSGKIFRKIQGVPFHEEEKEKHKKTSKKRLKEKDKLQLQLEMAIEQEDYELAAKLRDELNCLKAGTKNG